MNTENKPCVLLKSDWDRTRMDSNCPLCNPEADGLWCANHKQEHLEPDPKYYDLGGSDESNLSPN